MAQRITHIEVRTWHGIKARGGFIVINRIVGGRCEKTYRIETELRLRRSVALLQALWGRL